MTKTNRICVGVIGGSFGVRGEARLKSFCAEPSAIADYGPLYTEDGNSRFTITITRPIKGGFGVRLSGIASKEQADALKGTRLFADRAALPTLPDDEYYHSDLIGLEAVDTGGTSLGRVSAVHDHGAGDLLELADGTLVPFTQAVVPTVDLGAGRLVIDLPEGLI